MFYKELCLLVLVAAVSISGQIYVKPNGPADAVCPGEPCLTLNQLAVRIYYNNFSFSGSNVVFLPGNHSLLVFYLVNVSDITLRGYSNDSSQARIIIEQFAPIFFINVSNLQIESLTFILCKNQCQYNTSLFLIYCT